MKSTDWIKIGCFITVFVPIGLIVLGACMSLWLGCDDGSC